jgi:hypothetical protein
MPWWMKTRMSLEVQGSILTAMRVVHQQIYEAVNWVEWLVGVWWSLLLCNAPLETMTKTEIKKRVAFDAQRQ